MLCERQLYSLRARNNHSFDVRRDHEQYCKVTLRYLIILIIRVIRSSVHISGENQFQCAMILFRQYYERKTSIY